MRTGLFLSASFPLFKKTVTQIGAIAHYCGKLSGLYPKVNDFETAKIDEILDLVTDINHQMGPALRESDSDFKKRISD